MGIFSRLAALVRSNINALIDKAEDPEKMLNQIVADMANQLIEAKKQVAISIADEKKLAKQAEGEAAKAAEWQRRAMMAVRAGDDALAKEALMRKKEHEQLATEFKDQWAKQKKQVDGLKAALRVLNSKIEEAKRKKAVLIARKRRAEAQEKIQRHDGAAVRSAPHQRLRSDGRKDPRHGGARGRRAGAPRGALRRQPRQQVRQPRGELRRRRRARAAEGQHGPRARAPRRPSPSKRCASRPPTSSMPISRASPARWPRWRPRSKLNRRG